MPNTNTLTALTFLVPWLAIPRSYEGRRFDETYRVYFQGKRKTDSSKLIKYKLSLYYCIVGHNEVRFGQKGTQVAVETTASVFRDGDGDRLPSKLGTCVRSYMQLHPTFNAMKISNDT